MNCSLSNRALRIWGSRVRVPPWLRILTQGTLTYQLNENDDDALQLVDDADVALAKKHGSEPLKITSTEVDTRNVFDHASAELAKHGLDAPSTELKKLLDVLQFRPRRLVKCGLAPPKALKNTLKGDEAEEPEDVYVVEMAEALAIEDEPKPETTGLAALQKTANEAAAALDKEADATLDDAALAAKLQAEEYGNHDVILEAVTGRGIKLDSNTLHSLLRILYCRPARSVQLGLVEDIKAARQAFKLGGKACANEWFRNKGCHGKGGKDRRVPLPDLPVLEIQFLHPQPQRLHQPQPRAVHQARDQPRRAAELRQHRAHLAPRHHHRHMARAPRPRHPRQVTELAPQHLPVQEQQRRQSLVLRRGRHRLVHRQVSQESLDLGLAHRVRVALAVEQDEAANPVNISLLRA